MLEGLFIASLVGTVCQWFKEATEPTIPAENWGNKKLINEDRTKRISDREFAKNLKNGKYIVTDTYPEPHRMEDGRIIIENYELYREDCRKFGVPQAHEWMRQGKYNLSQEELREREEKFKKNMDYLYSLL